MSVIKVDPLSSGVAGKGGKGGRAYVSTYLVLTDHKDDSPVTVSYGARNTFPGGFPFEGDYYWWGTPGSAHYSQDPEAYCLWPPDIKLKQDDQNFRRVWLVTVKHETPESADSRASGQNNPLTEDWEFSCDADEWTEEATMDKDGKPIRNSAGEQFKGKLVQVYKSRARYHLARNYASVNPMTLDDIRMSVNSARVKLDGRWYGPRMLLMRRVRYSRKIFAAVLTYYRVEFEIDSNPDTFDLTMADMGWREFIGGKADPNDPKSYRWIKDFATKHNTPTQLYLDGHGNVQPFNLPAVPLNFKYYKERVWPFSFP